MRFEVFFVSEAEQDIMDIYRYLFISDSKEKADYVFNKTPGEELFQQAHSDSYC